MPKVVADLLESHFVIEALRKMEARVKALLLSVKLFGTLSSPSTRSDCSSRSNASAKLIYGVAL